MKKFIALLLTAFLIISCTACGESSENKKITEPKVSQMKSICELAVMDCYYHNVAKYNEKNASGWWLWTQDKEFWIEYSGIVTLGVDVSLVSMEIDGDNITITIPPATVQNCEVDESALTKDSYIVAQNSAEVTAEDEVMAFGEAQKKLEETAAADKNLLAEAQQRTQILLEDYIKNIGNTVGKEYTINWKYIDENGNSSNAQSATDSSVSTEETTQSNS